MIEIKDIGQLSERVNIYAQTISVSSTTGERTQTFALTGAYWALVEYGSGSETISNDIAYDVNRLTVTIKYNTSVNDNSILEWESRKYNIRSVEFDNRKMFMKLICEGAK